MMEARTTRRTLLRIATVALRTTTLCAAAEASRLAVERPSGAVTTHSRSYRVVATVELLSVPLYHNNNAGGGWVTVEEANAGPTRTTVLQFSGGSWPDRLRGFNRFGMTQEVTREEGSMIAESAYLSFITTSADKSLNQARQAFEEHSDTLSIEVSYGNSTRAGYASALDRLKVPAKYNWCDCARLMRQIRDRLSPVGDPLPGSPGGEALPAFLHAVRGSMLSGVESARRLFVHAGKFYTLRTRLTPSGAQTLLTGWISEKGSARATEFRIWFDSKDAAALPIRIEFRPRSFLRLVFEHDPKASGPAFAGLISEEET